jgi:hypothetical protein
MSRFQLLRPVDFPSPLPVRAAANNVILKIE